MDIIDVTIVIIDDDKTLGDPKIGLIPELNEQFKTVEFFQYQNEGLDFIKANLEKRMIVLLDLDFPSGTPNGHKILEKIRECSFLIPVIIWSGVDEDTETFADLINNKAFGFLNKNASSEEIVKKIIEAYNYVEDNVSIALEDWISSHLEEEREKPYMISVSGKQMSLNDILKEIRLQTDEGKGFSKKLIKLTIDLLTRNKEKIDD